MPTKVALDLELELFPGRATAGVTGVALPVVKIITGLIPYLEQQQA